MKINRRDLLHATGAGALAVGVGCRASFALGIAPNATYDEVLEALFRTDLEFGSFTNHGPMVADALAVDGKPERIVAWVEQYGRDLLPRTTGASLTANERAGALGSYDKRGRWIATYEADLEVTSPKDLLRREWPTLGPGLIGALWHGLLRAAHAVRALQREETPARRRELAHGLGYWAAKFQPLPGKPGSRAVAGRDVATALAAVPLVPGSARTTKGSVEGWFKVLDGRADFIDAVEQVDLQAQAPDQALTAIVAAASRLLVNHGKRDIVLLHAITGAAIVRLLFPWLDSPQQREAVGYAFQGVAASHAILAPSTAAFGAVAAPTRTIQALFATAAASDDAHDIKLGEAAAREVALGAPLDIATALDHWLT